MGQICVFERFRTGEEGKTFVRRITKLLQEGYTVVPNTQVITTDQFGWATVMVFVEKKDDPNGTPAPPTN
jgi:hypothetical protein